MKRLWIMVLACAVCCSYGFAEEGMWLLGQIQDLGLNEKGLVIPIEEIYSPDKPCLAHAVVNLGSGTGTLVSQEGLLLTNHHVAFEAVQRASTPEKNYIQTGFLARTRDEEIQAPGYSVFVLERMTDVTDKVLAAAAGLEDPLEKSRAIDATILRLEEEAATGDDVAAQVSSMFLDKQFLLFVYRRFDDVRVVYVPPSSIGNYGGEIDNWMWPRHTGDFSFLRVYTGPDGRGRPHHEDNVPYRPKMWLKISTGNLNEGDFTFILGYPGFTTRYRTSNSAAYNFLHKYPTSIRNFQEIIDMLQELSQKDQEAAIKTAGLEKALNNTLKNYQGQVDGVAKTQFLSKKKEFEKRFLEYVRSDEERERRYGDILSKIEAEYQDIYAHREYDDTVMRFSLAGTLFAVATTIYGIAAERAKTEKDPSFSEREVAQISARLKYQYYSYCEPADKAMLAMAMKMAAKLPETSRLKGLEESLNGDIDAYVEEMYRATQLKDVRYAESLFRKTREELESLGDPMIDLAKKFYPEQESFRSRYDRFAAHIVELRRRYLDALYSWQGQKLYPDANGTLRFTYGHVAGYSPRDAVSYLPFTRLSGVIAKDTGKDPFVVPEELKALHEKRDFGRWVDPELKDVPVAFTHCCDITGGNSGSPVLNAQGEMVGVAFDGNYEGMISDWQYDYALQRAISVDIRYVLFIVEKMAGADHILRELGLN